MLFGIHMQHPYCESNQVADSLSMYDLSQSISLKMLNLVPKFMHLPIFKTQFVLLFLDASCLFYFSVFS